MISNTAVDQRYKQKAQSRTFLIRSQAQSRVPEIYAALSVAAIEIKKTALSTNIGKQHMQIATKNAFLLLRSSIEYPCGGTVSKYAIIF